MTDPRNRIVDSRDQAKIDPKESFGKAFDRARRPAPGTTRAGGYPPNLWPHGFPPRKRSAS